MLPQWEKGRSNTTMKVGAGIPMDVVAVDIIQSWIGFADWHRRQVFVSNEEIAGAVVGQKGPGLPSFVVVVAVVVVVVVVDCWRCQA